jgi:hypothetical protein
VSPPLFEGDKAILLLVKSSRYEGRYEPLAWVGVNRVVNGVIQANLFEGEDVNALEGVTVRSQIHGMGAAEFLDTLTTAAEENQ